MHPFTIIASSRGERFAKFFEGLKNGDPMSWGTLGVVILLAIVFYIYDKKKEKREG